MSKLIPLLLTFVGGLLCGVVALSLLSPDPNPSREVVPDANARESSTAPGPDDADPIDLGTPVPATASVDADSSADGAGASLLARAIASIPVEFPDDLSGTISGTVVSIDGTPIAGAKITASPIFPEGSRYSRPQYDADDLEARIRWLVQSRKRSDVVQVETVSDVEGAFQLERIGSTEYRVRVECPGFKFSNSSFTVSAGDPVEFVGEAQAIARIEVKNADGSMASNVRIQFEGGNGSMGRSWSEKEPLVTIWPGRFQVTASSGDLFTESVDAEFSVGEETLVSLVLRARPGISGKLIFPPEEVPQRGVFVVLLSREKHPDPRLEELEGNAPRTSSQMGSYEFTNLDVGEYWLGVARGRWVGDALDCRFVPVTITAEATELDLDIPPVDRGRAIHATVVSNEGRPVRDASFIVQIENADGGGYGGGAESVKLRDGGFLVQLHRGQLDRYLEKGGTIALTARTKDGSVGSAPVPGLGSSVQLTLSGVASVTVQVLGLPEVAEQVSVHIESDVQDHYSHSQKLDGNREARIDNVPAGAGSLTVQARLPDRGSHQIHREPIFLAVGSSFLSVTVPHLHSLTVIAPQDVETGRFYLRGESSHTAIIVDGVATFSFVPPGSYKLVGHGGQMQGEQNVVVPTSGPIPFEPVLPNALRVSIHDENGAFARAGLREGDIVVSIGGEMASGRDQLQMLGILLQTDPTVTLVVVRDEIEREIEIDSAILIETNPGGAFYPVVY